jgi:short-subunit dehydrogenase
MAQATTGDQAAPKIRWAVVTGASSGIGAELARDLAARGFHLFLTARRQDRLDYLAAELATTRGARVETGSFDLRTPQGVDELLADIAARGIVVDTFVNNAGFGLRGRFADLPLETQEEMLAVNIGALTRLCRKVLPDLIARGRGGIINVASTAAFQAGPNMAVYYASKAYVLSLSEALHEEAKPHGVVVTALCPGPTNSEFADVAGMDGSKLFRSNAMKALDVARAGVDGYLAGHAIVVPGLTNAIGVFAAGLLPRNITRRLAGRLQA